MNDSLSSNLATVPQAKNTTSKNELSPELKARRDAVWQGERLVLETHFAEARIMHSIGYLGILNSGVSVALLTNLMRNLTRFTDDSGLLKGKVLVDLREARFESNAYLAKALGTSVTSVCTAIAWLIERDFLRSTGKKGKLKREIAFGGTFLDRVTGSPTVVKKAKAMPSKGSRKQSRKSSVAAKQDEKPCDGFIEKPCDGYIVLKDLVPQEELNPNQIQARNQEPVCLRQPGFVVRLVPDIPESEVIPTLKSTATVQKRPVIAKRELAGLLADLYLKGPPPHVFEGAVAAILMHGSREKLRDLINQVKDDYDHALTWGSKTRREWEKIMVEGYVSNRASNEYVPGEGMDVFEKWEKRMGKDCE